jgi:hypothetical protein
MSASNEDLSARVEGLESKLDAILGLLQNAQVDGGVEVRQSREFDMTREVQSVPSVAEIDLTKPMPGFSTEQGGTPERGNKPTPLVKQQGLENPVPYSPPPAPRPSVRDKDGEPFPQPAVFDELATQAAFEREFLGPMRAMGLDQNKRPAGYEID